MKCATCERLGTQHNRLKRTHDMANISLTGAATGTDQGRFMTLKTLADEAQIDLELLETEIMRHLSTGHAPVTRAPRAIPDSILSR